jgi:hypothetical protein
MFIALNAFQKENCCVSHLYGRGQGGTYDDAEKKHKTI